MTSDRIWPSRCLRRCVPGYCIHLDAPGQPPTLNCTTSSVNTIHLQLGPVSIETRKGVFQTRRVPHNQNVQRHWSERAKWNVAWYDAVGWAWKEATSKNPTKLPLAFPQITVTLFHIHESDWDNAFASIKPLIDGLKVARVIEDDSPGEIPQPQVRQVKVNRRQDEHVEILVAPR